MRLAVGRLLLALPALAQLDSAALRAKFGPPLNIGVDYGTGGQVCAITLTQRHADEFLAEVVPDAMRGKELNQMMGQMGLAWFSTVEYEHVTITETEHGDTRNRTTMRFKTEGCP